VRKTKPAAPTGKSGQDDARRRGAARARSHRKPGGRGASGGAASARCRLARCVLEKVCGVGAWLWPALGDNRGSEWLRCLPPDRLPF
jgi:hypothetical protein